MASCVEATGNLIEGRMRFQKRAGGDLLVADLPNLEVNNSAASFGVEPGVEEGECRF